MTKLTDCNANLVYVAKVTSMRCISPALFQVESGDMLSAELHSAFFERYIMPDPTIAPSSATASTQATVTTDEETQLDEEELLDEEFEEELIIEDFTIDGICGVY